MVSVAPVLQNLNIAAQNGVPFFSFGKPVEGGAIRKYNIGGIIIRAFFDSTQKLLFVVDETKDSVLPNALLVIKGDGVRKWDDILQSDFGISPETVRPRLNNKYQKLDIEYEGLDVYANAIAQNNSNALASWRNGVAKRVREARSSDAGRQVGIARATVGEAENTIREINEFISAQKQKLKAAKENMGKESPKESAAKILRYEGRIEKAIEKKKRAQRRMKRAQKRIDSSSKMLNNYASILIEGRDDMAEGEVKPLFTENPNIMDTQNAFKPVSFVPQAMPAPSAEQARPTIPSVNIQPAEMSRPVSPITGESVRIDSVAASAPGRQSGAYYLMLTMLIGLSIFTLYLYQKKMNSTEMPHIAAVVSEAAPAQPVQKPAIQPEPIPEQLPVVPLPEAAEVPEMIADETPFLMGESQDVAAQPEIIEPGVEPALPIFEPEPVFEEPVAAPEPAQEIVQEQEFVAEPDVQPADYSAEEVAAPEVVSEAEQYQQVEGNFSPEPISEFEE